MNKLTAGNIALSHLRSKRTLQSIPDASVEGKTVDLFFEAAQESVLRDYPYAFSSRVETLIESAVAPPADWFYRYVYPTTCLAARRIIFEGITTDTPPIPFTVEIIPGSDAKSIVTNQAEAQLRFTSNVKDIDRWPSDAALALTWLLAALMMPSINGNTTNLESFYGMYRRLASIAMVAEANASVSQPRATPLSITSRMGN